MIPKIIHYCWFGGAEKTPLIQRCLETWRKIMPDYEIKEWNESNFDINSVPYVREAFEARKWAFMADYVRLYAMYTEGGIYMDTDVKVMRKFDTFLKYSFFTCQESHPDIMPEDAITIDGQRNPSFEFVRGIGLCSAVMGAEKGNVFLKDCLDKYNTMHFKAEKQEDLIIVNVIAVLLEKYGYRYILDKNQILPGNMAVFKPHVFAGLSTLTHDSYAMHLYNGSWVDSNSSLKHRLRNQFPDLYTFIQKSYYKIHPPKKQTPVKIERLQHGMKVLQIACYAQPAMGNFIRSISALEQELLNTGVETVYVFWDKVSKHDWYKEFAATHKCYLVQDNSKASTEIFSLLEQEHPDIVHTHFTGFDIAACRACKQYKRKYKKNIHLIWHLHNDKSLSKNAVNSLYWKLKLYMQYNFYGRNANIISANTQTLQFSNYYRSLLGKEDKKLCSFLLNSIDLSKVESPTLPLKRHQPFTFLAIGTLNSQKRFDCLLAAGELLIKQGENIKIILTKGSDAESVVNEYFKNDVPEWAELIPEDTNVNNLFSQADCFVSTSVQENFSHYLCEATAYGLPVIQSNIEGTAWNNNNPSTYLFESLSVDQLSQQMWTVMNDDICELTKHCEITRNNNRQTFSLETWCQEIIAFYNSVIDNS